MGDILSSIIVVRSHYPDRRIKKEIDSLIEGGYKVSLLAWDRGRYKNQMPSERCSLIRLKLDVPAGSIKVALYLPIWWLFVIFHLLSQRYDAIHAVDFDSFVPALFVSFIKRKKVVYDILDFYADTIAFPVFPKTTRRIVTLLDRFLMKWASFVIIADESRKEQIGNNAKNVIIINNSPKMNILKGINLIKSCGDGFRIFFGGGIQPDRHIDTVISAVKDISDVELVIVGFCDPKTYEKKIRESASAAENIKLVLEAVPYEEIIKGTVNADLLFALYDSTIISNNKYASPNKLFEAMMCKKPIIVGQGTSMTSIVNEEKCGLIVPCGDIESIKGAILKLRDDPKLREEMGEYGRMAYETKYSWDIMSSRLVNAYSEVLRDI